MARLRFIALLGSCLILAPAISRAQQAPSAQTNGPGVCARCHVSAVLEWGISRHSKIDEARNGRFPNCVGCHGVSKDHVIDEQNTFKPDRVPHGDAIAALCTECHKDGCPETKSLKDCQTCHHMHALVNPKLDSAMIEKQANELAARVNDYKNRLAEGERLAKLGEWAQARAAFAAALSDEPASDLAADRLKMVSRRLDPGLGGFKIVGDQYDPQSGLPKEIVMADLSIAMTLVPAGSFDMGSDRSASEQPVHTVSVAPFYLATREMTQAQWKALMASNPSRYQGDKFPRADTMPVEQVSWDDCRAMLGEINKRISAGAFRLPTEAEWEYAARGGSDAAGSVLSVAWLRENSLIADSSPAATAGSASAGTLAPLLQQATGAAQNVEAAKLVAPDSYAPHPVGALQPDRLGLYDMQGNVSEWCSSLALPYPFNEGDGRESASAPGARILRGANFADAIEAADPALRHSERPDRKLRWNGVRLAYSPPEPARFSPPAGALAAPPPSGP